MLNTYPAIKKVQPTDDYKLILTFSNGEMRLFDMKPYLNKGIFIELLNLSMFNTAHVSFDTVEWDNHADFDPEVLYKLGKKISKQNILQFLGKLLQLLNLVLNIVGSNYTFLIGGNCN